MLTVQLFFEAVEKITSLFIMSTLNSNPASTNSISSIDAEKQKVYDEFQFISKINEIVINDTLVIKLKPTDNYDWARGIKYSTGGYFSQRLLLDLPPDKWTTIDKKYNTYHIRQSEYWDWKTFKSRELTDLLKSKTPFKVTINGLDLSISSCFKTYLIDMNLMMVLFYLHLMVPRWIEKKIKLHFNMCTFQNDCMVAKDIN